MCSLSRNAVKQTIHLFNIFIMQIQHGRHEMTKVILSSSIIGIETILFTKPYVFCIKGYNKKDDTFILHHYHAKFKMAAIVFVNPLVIIN